jgi:hypothetical protein
MTTLTVRISDKKHAKMLYEMLSEMKFVKQVDMEDEYKLSEAHIKILEDRLEDYKKNPKSGLTLEQTVAKIRKKHGFKNNR